MRVAVYLLLFANLVMAGWLYSHQDNYRVAPDVRDTRSTGGEMLQLLAERTSSPTASTPIQTPAAEATSTVALVPEAPETPGAADIDATETMPSLPAPPSPAAELPAPALRTCHVLGPFPERESAQRFATKLIALGAETAVRTSQIEEPSGYWVYLPSMPRDDAQRIVAELKAKGVKDLFLGRQYFISLGVFTDKGTAEARTQAITALGYTPILEPRYLHRDIYWLDADESGNTPISAAQWLSLIDEQKGIKHQILTCE